MEDEMELKNNKAPLATIENPEEIKVTYDDGSDAEGGGGGSERKRCLSCSGVNLRTLVLVVVVACMMSLLGGTTLSYSSSTLLELQELPNIRFRFEDTLLSDLFGASAMIGSIFGGPVGGLIADQWGRKTSLVLNVIPYLLGYFTVLCTYLIPQPASFKAIVILGRGITGIGLGWSFMIVPIYIGEIAPARVRGVFISFADIFLSIGILSSYGLGAVPDLHYYDVALVFLAVMVLFIFAVLPLPETPRWLMLKWNAPKQAIKVMSCFRGPGSSQTIVKELDMIKAHVPSKKSSLRSKLTVIFCRKETLAPVLLSLFVCTYHQLSGVGVVTTYTGHILDKSGVPNPKLVSFCAAGLAFLLARVTSGFLVEVAGRKSLYIVSSVGICASHLTMGIMFYLTQSTCSSSDSDAVCGSSLYPMAIAGIVLFAFSFGIGAGPITWILLSEYLPLRIKGIAGGISVLCNRLVAVILSGTFLSFSKYAGPWAPWFLLASINLAGLVIIILFVVETKGRTLEEVQQLFHDRILQVPCRK